MTSSTPSRTRSRARRVLVAIDNTTLRDDMLEIAARLAADLGAELQGLYFEDETLLRIADLPFVQEITTSSGAIRPINAHSALQAMQHQAAQVQQVLRSWAKSEHVRCSFSIQRGRALRNGLAPDADTDADDVLFLGGRSHAPRVRRPMGLRGTPLVHPLLLVADDSSHSARAVAATVAVARKHARPIVLLIYATDRSAFERAGGSISQLLCNQKLPHTMLPYPIATASALIRSARDQRPEMLLINRHCPVVTESTLESLLNQLDCPIVLV